MDPQNNEIDSVIMEPVQNENVEDFKIISADLKELIQFLKDNKIESDKIAEAEKQIQLEADNQQIELDEQNQIKNLEEQKKEQEEEQLLLDSENEFRTNLIDSLSLQNEKMDTYIQKSDGLFESIESLNETTSVLVQNTEISDKELVNQEVTYYSGLAILVLVMIFVPSFIMVKFFMSLFRHII